MYRFEVVKLLPISGQNQVSSLTTNFGQTTDKLHCGERIVTTTLLQRTRAAVNEIVTGEAVYFSLRHRNEKLHRQWQVSRYQLRKTAMS